MKKRGKRERERVKALGNIISRCFVFCFVLFHFLSLSFFSCERTASCLLFVCLSLSISLSLSLSLSLSARLYFLAFLLLLLLLVLPLSSSSVSSRASRSLPLVTRSHATLTMSANQ